MGTEKTRELQTIIKELCTRAGWSQKRLAREIYIASQEYDDEDDIEINRFEEKLKKALSRPTTKPEQLQHYLDVMRDMTAIEKTDLIVPQYHSSKVLEPELEKAMLEISKELTKKLRD
jgi:transcriptional regulator with XRE-family HTH domain